MQHGMQCIAAYSTCIAAQSTCCDTLNVAFGCYARIGLRYAQCRPAPRGRCQPTAGWTCPTFPPPQPPTLPSPPSPPSPPYAPPPPPPPIYAASNCEANFKACWGGLDPTSGRAVLGCCAPSTGVANGGIEPVGAPFACLRRTNRLYAQCRPVSRDANARCSDDETWTCPESPPPAPPSPPSPPSPPAPPSTPPLPRPPPAPPREPPMASPTEPPISPPSPLPPSPPPPSSPPPAPPPSPPPHRHPYILVPLSLVLVTGCMAVGWCVAATPRREAKGDVDSTCQPATRTRGARTSAALGRSGDAEGGIADPGAEEEGEDEPMALGSPPKRLATKRAPRRVAGACAARFTRQLDVDDDDDAPLQVSPTTSCSGAEAPSACSSPPRMLSRPVGTDMD